MRLLKDKRGQIRTIEAFFASILLLSALTLIPVTQNNLSKSYASLSSTTHNLLVSLDSNGCLSGFINSKNWVDLKKTIQSAISPTIWFNVTVFDENMTLINDTPISSGSVVSNNIVAVDYVCATTSSNYAVYIIRLQLGQVD